MDQTYESLTDRLDSERRQPTPEELLELQAIYGKDVKRYVSLADCQENTGAYPTPEELKEFWEARIADGVWRPRNEEEKANVEEMVGHPIDVPVKSE